MNDILTLDIQREDGTGSGIAFLDGRAVFVPGALAGEKVRAQIVRRAKRTLHARLLQVDEPSAQRRTPPCPYALRCGGCTMQHMDYARTLSQKEGRVADCLARIGGIAVDNYLPIAPMAHPWRYRNKATVPIAGEAVGFYRAGSRDIVPVEDCLLQPPSFARALAGTREWLSRGNRAESLLVRTAASGSMLAAIDAQEAGDWPDTMRAQLPELAGALRLDGGRAQPLWGSGALADSCCGLRSNVSALSFRQVNTAQAEVLYQIALALLDLRGDERVVDAYCGAGILTQLLAGRCQSAVGFEIAPQAIAEAMESAQLNGVKNVRFVEGDCDVLMQGIDCDVLVLDPPRRGCSPKVIEAALDAMPKKLLYISCDPATLARDVKSLAQGGYKVSTVAPVDMFPWTAHVETIVLLQCENS